jgi:hypothetical protein
MKAGTYTGIQVVGCYTGESKEKKTPFFAVELMHTQSNQYIDWVVYLKDDSPEAIERARKSMQTLKDIGFKGMRLSDLSDVSKKISDLFGAPVAEISIVVEEEVIMKKNENTGMEEPVLDLNGQPKKRGVLRWVNVGGPSKFDHSQAVAKFNSLKFDSILAGIKANATTGAPQPGPAETASGTGGAQQSGTAFSFQQNANNGGAQFANDDIPF